MSHCVSHCAGFDVLTAMERVAVDGDDRPEQEIKITGASVFVNPYKEMEEEERKKAEAERKQASCITALWHHAVLSGCPALHHASHVILQGIICVFGLVLEFNAMQ